MVGSKGLCKNINGKDLQGYCTSCRIKGHDDDYTYGSLQKETNQVD